VKEMHDHLNASYDEFCDCFKIETNDNYMKDIKIYDLSGKIIMTKQTENKSIRIETDKISRGLYILEIDSNNKKIIKSLIKY
jgi:AraC-like DNA-binding protein